MIRIEDKIAPYFSQEDRAYIERARETIETLTAGLVRAVNGSIKAKEAGTASEEEQRLFETEARARQYELEARQSELSQKIQEAHERYWETFKGDPEALYREAKEVLDSATKEDFLEYIAQVRSIIDYYQRSLDEGEEETEEERDNTKQLIARLSEETAEDFDNCYSFLLLRAAHEYLMALEYCGYGDEENITLLSLVEARAAELYPRPGKGGRPKAPERTQATGELLNLASSPITNGVYDVLDSGGNFNKLVASKKKYNPHTQITATSNENARRVQFISPNADISIEIANIEALAWRTPKVAKLFTHILVKGNQQVTNGYLTDSWVVFPLADFVGEGGYSNMDSARKGIKKAAEILKSLSVKGSLTTGRKEQRIDFFCTLFPTIGVSYGSGLIGVRLNPDINWGMLFKYFTVIPDYYLELSDNACELLRVIVTAARQSDNYKKIASGKPFTITFAKIRQALSLPDNSVKNKRRLIADPIEDAVAEIEAKNREYGIQGFDLILQGDTLPVSQYIDKGKLAVTLSGDMATTFIERNEAAQEKITAAVNRKKRITEKAETQALARKIEAEQAAEN